MFIILAQFYSSTPTPDYAEIAAVLRKRGHKVWLITPDNTGDLAVENGTALVSKLKIPAFPEGKLFTLPVIKTLVSWFLGCVYAIRLRRFIYHTRPDIFHMNRARLPFFWMIPLLGRKRTQYIIDWRQIAERDYEGWLGKLKRFVLVQYRLIPSRYFFDQACFLHDAGAKQVLGTQWRRWATVVPLAVSANLLQCEHNSFRSEDSNLAVRFIYIGTLTEVRRLDRIILAAKELHSRLDNQNNFHISFVGPDAAGGLYQRMVNDLDLSNSVSILPPVPYQDIPDVLGRHDVALAILPEYPLDWQYHPTLKILEYRAFGIPIIATDFKINREVVRDGVNGLLVENSAAAIAGAMQVFIQDREFLNQSVAHAREMRQGHLWSEIAEKYEQLYQRLVD